MAYKFYWGKIWKSKRPLKTIYTGSIQNAQSENGAFRTFHHASFLLLHGHHVFLIKIQNSLQTNHDADGSGVVQEWDGIKTVQKTLFGDKVSSMILAFRQHQTTVYSYPCCVKTISMG